MILNWTDLIQLNTEGVTPIKNAAGVYRLSYKSPSDNNYHVYYVGQAEDLCSRLFDHLLQNEVNSKCRQFLKSYDCFFRAALVPNKAVRDGVEVALYNKFSPTCCERMPNALPADINY